MNEGIELLKRMNKDASVIRTEQEPEPDNLVENWQPVIRHDKIFLVQTKKKYSNKITPYENLSDTEVVVLIQRLIRNPYVNRIIVSRVIK